MLISNYKNAPVRSSIQQRRNLSIHEYLSARLLKSVRKPIITSGRGQLSCANIPFLNSTALAFQMERLQRQPKRPRQLRRRLVLMSGAKFWECILMIADGDDMVIKAQVLAGGRGKGSFDNGLKGGVRVIYSYVTPMGSTAFVSMLTLHDSPTEAKMFAEQMIGHKLITKQTGARGRICNSVYICERKFARREFYLAILMDRSTQSPVIVASSQGGMDIETVAKETPDAIITTPVDINTGVTDEMARNIATQLGFSEQCIEDAKNTIQRLYKVFMDKDATQIEINPLSETSDHQVLAMDAKLGFDDNAEFRQKEVFSWRDTTQEDPDEVKAAE